MCVRHSVCVCVCVCVCNLLCLVCVCVCVRESVYLSVSECVYILTLYMSTYLNTTHFWLNKCMHIYFVSLKFKLKMIINTANAACVSLNGIITFHMNHTVDSMVVSQWSLLSSSMHCIALQIVSSNGFQSSQAQLPPSTHPYCLCLFNTESGAACKKINIVSCGSVSGWVTKATWKAVSAPISMHAKTCI